MIWIIVLCTSATLSNARKNLTEKTPAGLMPGPLFRDHLASKRSIAMKTIEKPMENQFRTYESAIKTNGKQ